MGPDLSLGRLHWLLQGHEWEQKILGQKPSLKTGSLTEMSELGCQIPEQGRNEGMGLSELGGGFRWALPYLVLPGRGERLV